jgi:DNA-binding LytR/AlgR family response regulator
MKARILIVEDEVMVAKVIQLHIENAGYICAGIAIDYEEALEILGQGEVDMALLDVNISGDQRGTEIADFINMTYKVPILYLTAYTDRQTIDEIKATNPYGYLKKPVDKDTLLITIELALDSFAKQKSEQVMLKIGKDTYQFPAHELLYAEADHIYVSLVMTTGKNFLLRSSLTAILASLPPNLLKQINRSQAINPKYIERISGNKAFLVQQPFKISPLFKDNF